MHYLLKKLTAHSPPWDLSWWVPLEQDKDSEEEEAETRPFSWVSVGHCLLWILANNCFHAGLQHLMAHVLIYPTSRFCPTYSLFSPYPSNFFLFHYSEGDGKKDPSWLSAQGVSEKTYSSLPMGWRHFHPSRSTKKGPGVCLMATRLIFAVNCFLQKLAMDRNMHHQGTESKPSPEERGAPGLCLPAQGHRGEIPFFKPPWFMGSQINGIKANRSQKNSNEMHLWLMTWWDSSRGAGERHWAEKYTVCADGEEREVQPGEAWEVRSCQAQELLNGKIASYGLQWIPKCFSSD